MFRSVTTSIALTFAAPSVASAGVTWNSVQRIALAQITPDFAWDLRSSSQVLGPWSASVYTLGPAVPDPTFERAIALATHESDVGLGPEPWAELRGTASAMQAVPSSFGSAFARISLTANFTLTDTADFKLLSLRGSGFNPQGEIRARLTRGTEVVFDRLSPTTFVEAGRVEAGVYTLTLSASFSNGDRNYTGLGCDLRFTLPTPGAGLLLLAPALAHRRRNASTACVRRRGSEVAIAPLHSRGQ
jgi:hypothetical protein